MMDRMFRKVPLGMSRPAWTGTGTARPSGCSITRWLPAIRSTTNPALSSALTTFAPDTTGMLLGTSQEATRSQATLSVRVSSSGGPTTSSRASSAPRRSEIASSSWPRPIAASARAGQRHTKHRPHPARRRRARERHESRHPVWQTMVHHGPPQRATGGTAEGSSVRPQKKLLPSAKPLEQPEPKKRYRA